MGEEAVVCVGETEVCSGVCVGEEAVMGVGEEPVICMGT